jgi:integrating conjugative element protein (TIGR03757 family)
MTLSLSSCRRSLRLRLPLPCGLFPLVLAIPVYLAHPPAVLAGPLTVEAFTDSRRLPINNSGVPNVSVTVYDLSAPQRAIDELNAEIKLPANKETATAIAKAFLQSHQDKLVKRILPTYEGQTKAINYEISRYPALVFNGHAVIYGITDIKKGLAYYQHWLETQTP